MVRSGWKISANGENLWLSGGYEENETMAAKTWAK